MEQRENILNEEIKEKILRHMWGLAGKRETERKG